MQFNSFSIRLKADENHNVDSNAIDKMICDKFGLTFKEKDYGHFIIPEEDNFHQESISWVGLLHCVIYYSDIEYGRKSIYEILGAMISVMKHAVHFPQSTLTFLHNLLDYLYSEGYYVFVHYHERSTYKDFFRNGYNEHHIYQNKTGLFECNINGELVKFYPSIGNICDMSIIRNKLHDKLNYQPYIYEMIIPNNVKSVASGFFNDGLIDNRLIVSLAQLSKCNYVFARSKINIVEIDSLGEMGNAFFESEIGTLHVFKVNEMETTPTVLNAFQYAKINVVVVEDECISEDQIRKMLSKAQINQVFVTV